ncbi:peroxidase-like [Daphnia carinata]|uniref:peroxidase-like n=1 Tax=Daphnia carinata TaxID=120202 RepID=UPI00257F5457|nr:peroxidase-like [Daphnia carinata]
MTPINILVVLILSFGTILSMGENGSSRQLPLPSAPVCDPTYKYRTFDGTCNNLKNQRFGQANTINQRLMGPATYADGISKIRLSASGAPLPSTRLITTIVTVNESVSNNDASLMTMQWGQFLDHDFAQASAARNSTGGTISCCDGGRFGNVTANPDPECLHIAIPSNDPVYTNANCINMVRTSFGLYLNGSTPRSREQISLLTPWIDGSMIYGVTNATAQSLRDLNSTKGLMKVSIQNGKVFLPLASTCCPNDPNNTCIDATTCFTGGDTRLRQQPLLTVLHTLWLREHNRIANALFAKFGASKSSEYYYQEARRIVIAELQHITYTEYLSVILGPKGLFTGPYNPNSDPAMFNEFTAAAYRMGHSQLRSFIRLYEADGTRSNQSFFLGSTFNNATRLLYTNFFDNAIRGLTRSPAQTVDECFADDITSQLLRTQTASLGGDLISINMQRGRDHGMPPYIIARQIALKWLKDRPETPLPTTMDQLNTTTSPEIINYFKKVYESVKDIDLYIGGVTEDRLPGSVVGPTFTYIIAKQFENLRQSDRFFYSDTTQNVSFTAVQVNEIKKVTLARIICDNSDGTIQQIQPSVFRNPMGPNKPVPCISISGIDFAKFVK